MGMGMGSSIYFKKFTWTKIDTKIYTQKLKKIFCILSYPKFPIDLLTTKAKPKPNYKHLVFLSKWEKLEKKNQICITSRYQ
jgi:hypothetical protein